MISKCRRDGFLEISGTRETAFSEHVEALSNLEENGDQRGLGPYLLCHFWVSTPSPRGAQHVAVIRYSLEDLARESPGDKPKSDA